MKQDPPDAEFSQSRKPQTKLKWEKDVKTSKKTTN